MGIAASPCTASNPLSSWAATLPRAKMRCSRFRWTTITAAAKEVVGITEVVAITEAAVKEVVGITEVVAITEAAAKEVVGITEAAKALNLTRAVRRTSPCT